MLEKSNSNQVLTNCSCFQQCHKVESRWFANDLLLFEQKIVGVPLMLVEQHTTNVPPCMVALVAEKRKALAKAFNVAILFVEEGNDSI